LRSGASCRAGTGSTAGRRYARPWSRCRRLRCRSRSGSPMSCRGAFPGISRPSSTSSARPARSSGSGPGSTASRSISERTRRCSRRRAGEITATQGRWSRTEGLFGTRPGSDPGHGPDRRALAELLLERHGIVTRDGVRAEGIAGGYGAVYGELKALETLGLCRRGYFVEGLGGAQFALGGAVERLRELRPQDGEEEAEPLVLAAAD